MKKFIVMTFLCMAFWAFTAGGARGADYCVYPGGTGLNDLQNALTAAAGNTEDDTIKVVQGNYYGNFTYNSTTGYDINLEAGYTSGCASRMCNPENTILDAQGSGRVLYLGNSAGGDITVSGFTIRNGDSAVCCGGINAVSQSTGTAGGVALINNIITGNSSDDYGGGACTTSYAQSSGSAGDITLLNNIIAGNTAVNFGGGVSASSFSITGMAGTITFTNNTITDNDTEDDGGGIYFHIFGSNGLINVYNNIVWGNTATGDGGEAYLSKGSGCEAYAYYNDAVEGEMAGDGWDSGSSDTNIDADPLFVHPGYWNGDDWINGNYHLRSKSPCIDQGHNNPPSGLPGYDFEGDNRNMDGNKDGTATVDIGADEYAPKGVIAHFLMLLFN